MDDCVEWSVCLAESIVKGIWRGDVGHNCKVQIGVRAKVVFNVLDLGLRANHRTYTHARTREELLQYMRAQEAITTGEKHAVSCHDFEDEIPCKRDDLVNTSCSTQEIIGGTTVVLILKLGHGGHTTM